MAADEEHLLRRPTFVRSYATVPFVTAVVARPTPLSCPSSWISMHKSPRLRYIRDAAVLTTSTRPIGTTTSTTNTHYYSTVVVALLRTLSSKLHRANTPRVVKLYQHSHSRRRRLGQQRRLQSTCCQRLWRRSGVPTTSVCVAANTDDDDSISVSSAILLPHSTSTLASTALNSKAYSTYLSFLALN